MYTLGKKFLAFIKKWIHRKKEEKLDQLRNINHIVTDDLKCPICLTNPRNILLKPCKHLCLCNVCYKELSSRKCPICRKNIESYVEIFIA